METKNQHSPSMNQCVLCDRWFLETVDNAGCVCTECREEVVIDKGKDYTNV